MTQGEETASLVRRSASGDGGAWEQLVNRSRG